MGEFNDDEVQKLPFLGPMSRRIYVLTEKDDKVSTKELFIQRNDAFTTNLIGLLKSIRQQEVSEIRYSAGFDGFIRIYLAENGLLSGEYFGKSEKTFKNLKQKLSNKL